MRIMGLGFTGMAVALTGMLAVCAADSASAAAYTKDCRGTRQALQAGECVNLSYDNPSRVAQPCSGGSCYRSGSQKKNKKPQKEN
jgi:hypothetical protein